MLAAVHYDMLVMVAAVDTGVNIDSAKPKQATHPADDTAMSHVRSWVMQST